MESLLHPLIDFLSNTLPKADPVVQGVVMVLAIGVLIALLWYAVDRSYRIKKVKREREEFRFDLRVSEKRVDELNGRLAEMEKLQTSLNQSIEENGGLKEQIQQLRETLETTVDERDALSLELNSLEHRFESLQNLDTTVWVDAVRSDPPEFVSRNERKTRFITFLNLKGGVGKTTTVANLAASFATGVTGQHFRVLAVDLDFQGTLSNLTVEPDFLKDRRTSGRTSERLIDDLDGGEVGERLLHELFTPMSGTGDSAKVVVANDKLEHADFRHQAQFAVQQKEVRFRHRRRLHLPMVFDQFDFVFFDCPPRLTTSSINALLASDYVVIPTALHPNDVDAVRRTLMWLERLGKLSEYQARLAGVILSRTYRKGDAGQDLTKAEKTQFNLLERYVHEYDPGHQLFEKLIPQTSQVATAAATSTPLGASQAGREIYRPFATELCNRLKG